jgi:hypothetical protein
VNTFRQTKNIVTLLSVLSLAFAGTAAAQGKKGEGRKGKGPPAAQAPGDRGGGQQQARGQRGRGQGRGAEARGPRGRGQEQARQGRGQQRAVQQQARPQRQQRPRAGAVQVPDRQRGPRIESPAAVQQQQQRAPQITRRGGPAARERGPRIRERAQNFTGRQYNEVLQNFSRERRPRDYWRQRYDRIVQVRGGHYYLHNNYWYPAWGYDPGFTTYIYEVPVYAYRGLPPDQILSEVQRELQMLGYYRGAVDGLFGPLTRNALRQFQRDYGLPVTGAVDEATLWSLGMI